MACRKLLSRSEDQVPLLTGAGALTEAARIIRGLRFNSMHHQKSRGAPIGCGDGVSIAKGFSL